MATDTDKGGAALETFAREDRSFPPPKGFAANANARDAGVYVSPGGSPLPKSWSGMRPTRSGSSGAS